MKFRVYFWIVIWLLSVSLIQNPSLAQSESTPIIGIDWSNDGTKLAVIDSKRLTIFDAVLGMVDFTPVALRVFPNDRSYELHPPLFSPDGTQILVGHEIWNSRTVETLLKIDTNGYFPQWNSDGTEIAFRDRDDRGTSIYSTQNGVLLRHFTTGMWRAGTEPLWSPDNIYFVTLSGSDEILLFDAMAGAEVKRYSVGNEMIFSMSWSPDSSYLALGRSTAIQLGSPNSYPNIADVGGAKRNSVTILDIRDGHVAVNISGFRNIISKLTWSRDGLQLAGIDSFHSLYIWDSNTGALVDSYRTPIFETSLIKYSPYGGRLMIGLNTNQSIPTPSDSPFIPMSNFIEPALGEPIQFVAPDASPNKLQEILSQCVTDQDTLTRGSAFIAASQYMAFIEWAKHLSATVMPAACAADLQLVVEAITGTTPSVQ